MNNLLLRGITFRAAPAQMDLLVFYSSSTAWPASKHDLKSGYMGFAQLESSADATPAVMLSPAVAMAAEFRCEQPPAGARWLLRVNLSCHGNRRTQHNGRGGIGRGF